MKTITHPLLGKLVPSQGPYATYFSEDDDYDLALYIDGPAWLVKLELDYLSKFTDRTETIEKEFAVDANYLEQYGRGGMINRMEQLFDKTVAAQLPFIPIFKIAEIRGKIMDLMTEAFTRMDAEAAA